MTRVRQGFVLLIAVLLAVQVVRVASVIALVDTNPGAASGIWSSHPDVEIGVAMSAIGTAAHNGQAVGPVIFDQINRAALKAPLAAQPYLVRGVQAQLAGNTNIAKLAFQAAELRDPRSLPARYFLADYYLRAGDVRGGLTEFAALARLAPNGIASVTPYVASYARDPAHWPQMRELFQEEPQLQESTLEALAADSRNSSVILALADRAHRNVQSPWLARLVAALVSDGQFARAREVWASVAGLRAPSELVFDPKFADPGPPAPFNWTMTSSTVGLAERQSGGRLHVIYYGQEDGALASQLLLLPAGQYRLSMRVSPSGPQAKSLHWSLTCANAQTPQGSIGLDALASRAWMFVVPTRCAAQRLDLAGSSSDIPQQVDVTISDFALTRESSNG